MQFSATNCTPVDKVFGIFEVVCCSHRMILYYRGFPDSTNFVLLGNRTCEIPPVFEPDFLEDEGIYRENAIL